MLILPLKYAFIATFSLVSYGAKRWNVIFTAQYVGEVIITFYQRTFPGTSANQKKHYLKSYNNNIWYLFCDQ